MLRHTTRFVGPLRRSALAAHRSLSGSNGSKSQVDPNSPDWRQNTTTDDDFDASVPTEGVDTRPFLTQLVANFSTLYDKRMYLANGAKAGLDADAALRILEMDTAGKDDDTIFNELAHFKVTPDQLEAFRGYQDAPAPAGYQQFFTYPGHFPLNFFDGTGAAAFVLGLGVLELAATISLCVSLCAPRPRLGWVGIAAVFPLQGYSTERRDHRMARGH